MRLSLIATGIGFLVGSIMIFWGLDALSRYESIPEPMAGSVDVLLGVSSIIWGLGALLMFISVIVIVVGLVLPQNLFEKSIISEREYAGNLFCSQCGSKIPADSVFCYNCGNKIE